MAPLLEPAQGRAVAVAVAKVVTQTNHQGMIEVIAKLRRAEGDWGIKGGLGRNVVFA